ncbi:hypothetical protein EV702DRAFT_1207740 [Suillus placidus]|uniref:Uncharacterized protein n=1 Tax=Suillus placidus TaxID=48579 RepID=A0A9P7CVE0_9AGAM|nr:hypothetical protein EV702DRAFT_1207740 [Suillus placidus]
MIESTGKRRSDGSPSPGRMNKRSRLYALDHDAEDCVRSPSRSPSPGSVTSESAYQMRKTIKDLEEYVERLEEHVDHIEEGRQRDRERRNRMRVHHKLEVKHQHDRIEDLEEDVRYQQTLLDRSYKDAERLEAEAESNRKTIHELIERGIEETRKYFQVMCDGLEALQNPS